MPDTATPEAVAWPGLTVSDAARRLGISERSVRRYAKDGSLRSYREGRTLKILTPLDEVAIGRWFTVPEVAVILECSEQTVYRYLRAGTLEGRRVAGSWRITSRALNAYLEERGTDDY